MYQVLAYDEIALLLLLLISIIYGFIQLIQRDMPKQNNLIANYHDKKYAQAFREVNTDEEIKHATLANMVRGHSEVIKYESYKYMAEAVEVYDILTEQSFNDLLKPKK